MKFMTENKFVQLNFGNQSLIVCIIKFIYLLC